MSVINEYILKIQALSFRKFLLPNAQFQNKLSSYTVQASLLNVVTLEDSYVFA